MFFDSEYTQRNFYDDFRPFIEEHPEQRLILHETTDPYEIVAEMYTEADRMIYFSWRLFSDEYYQIFTYSPKEMTNEQRMEQFRLRLKRAMKEQCSMTQIELSQKTGISQQSLSKYLYTDVVPSLDYFLRIASALNCPLDRFEYRFTSTFEWSPPSHY